MSKLFTHAARQRELDEIATLPPERQEEKFARLDVVKRVNQREEAVITCTILVFTLIVVPYAILELLPALYSSDNKFTGKTYLHFIFVGLIIAFIGFNLGSCMSWLYPGAPQELNNRIENMDERDA
jgi:hypothetical protein